jgi:glycoside/pentoside/hexuronide:cation symporter, GPH family
LPHILIGGVLLALFYVFIWYVPDMFKKSQNMTVIYLIVVNMISRTLITWYYAPYVALGFEMSNDYNERNKPQSARYVCNMVFNLIFCGILVWHVFLIDSHSNRDTTIVANYAKIGIGFGAMILLLVLTTVFSTRSYSTDTRLDSADIGNGIKGFCDDMLGIFKDRNAVYVFLFFCVVSCSFVFVGATQMYVYVSFMALSPTEASIVHSSTMIAFAIGSLLATPIARRFDKKRAIYVGSGINILGNALIGLVFLTQWMQPGMSPFTGFIEGTDVQLPGVAFKLTQMMVFLGMFFTVFAVLFLIKHPITRPYMEKLRSQRNSIPEQGW